MARRILEKEECWYNHYDCGGAGYAQIYIFQKWDNKSLENKARLDIYRILFEIDFQLGTKSEIQLWWCSYYSVNLDIIKVIDIN